MDKSFFNGFPNILLQVARKYKIKLASKDLLKRSCTERFSVLVIRPNKLLYLSLRNIPFLEKPFVRGSVNIILMLLILILILI